MRTIGLCLVLSGLMAGCSKTESPAPAPSSSPAPAPSSASAPSSLEAPSSAAPSAVAPPPQLQAPAGAPASFKDGTKENIASAVGLGCEARSLNGWLQLLCRKKNGTGGHPVRAVVRRPGEATSAPSGQEPGSNANAGDAEAGDELTADEQGELTIVVPYSGDEKRDVTIEWTDTTYTLHVTGTKATLEWAAAGIPHRRACQQLLDETKAVLAAAQKAEGEARLTTTEASKLPRFGVCQPGGLGSWAIALKAAAGKGEGAAREHHLELSAVRVAVGGTRQNADFGAFDVAPGGLELGALQVYDFDDDGRDELIVPYEVKSTSGALPANLPPPIWSFSDAGVKPYAKAPGVSGGIGIEQLDFDMRPDLSSYAGFVAYLGADCGIKQCPRRVTGPKLFMHATADGGFTESDEVARSALKRTACPTKPSTIVAESGGSLNLVQTAKNLVCARAYSVASDAIIEELTSKHSALCGEAPTCALATTLEAWAKQTLPLELSTTPAPPKTGK